MNTKDLLVLCADKDAEMLLTELLKRLPQIENLPPFSFDIKRHPQRDGGVRTDAANFLRPLHKLYRFVLVIFDWEGCGENKRIISQLESDMKNDIVASGWQPENRVAVICLPPEIENWIWVKSQIIKDAINWQEAKDIYEWLDENGFARDATNFDKPSPPKEAFDALLEQAGESHSSALFAEIGEKASYRNCQDPNFWRMVETLRAWFSESA